MGTNLSDQIIDGAFFYEFSQKGLIQLIGYLISVSVLLDPVSVQITIKWMINCNVLQDVVNIMLSDTTSSYSSLLTSFLYYVQAKSFLMYQIGNQIREFRKNTY